MLGPAFLLRFGYSRDSLRAQYALLAARLAAAFLRCGGSRGFRGAHLSWRAASAARSGRRGGAAKQRLNRRYLLFNPLLLDLKTFDRGGPDRGLIDVGRSVRHTLASSILLIGNFVNRARVVRTEAG